MPCLIDKNWENGEIRSDHQTSFGALLPCLMSFVCLHECVSRKAGVSMCSEYVSIVNEISGGKWDSLWDM